MKKEEQQCERNKKRTRRKTTGIKKEGRKEKIREFKEKRESANLHWWSKQLNFPRNMASLTDLKIQTSLPEVLTYL